MHISGVTTSSWLTPILDQELIFFLSGTNLLYIKQLQHYDWSFIIYPLNQPEWYFKIIPKSLLKLNSISHYS